MRVSNDENYDIGLVDLESKYPDLSQHKMKTTFYKRDPGVNLPRLERVCVYKEAYKWSWYLSFYLHDPDNIICPHLSIFT